MPYSPERKEQTRAWIVESAPRMPNRRGFVAVSIDQIMANAWDERQAGRAPVPPVAS